MRPFSVAERRLCRRPPESAPAVSKNSSSKKGGGKRERERKKRAFVRRSESATGFHCSFVFIFFFRLLLLRLSSLSVFSPCFKMADPDAVAKVRASSRGGLLSELPEADLRELIWNAEDDWWKRTTPASELFNRCNPSNRFLSLSPLSPSWSSPRVPFLHHGSTSATVAVSSNARETQFATSFVAKNSRRNREIQNKMKTTLKTTPPKKNSKKGLCRPLLRHLRHQPRRAGSSLHPGGDAQLRGAEVGRTGSDPDQADG